MFLAIVHLDVPADDDTSPEAQRTRSFLDKNPEKATIIKDCLASLLRVAVRYAIHKEKLEGRPPANKDFSIKVSLPTRGQLGLCSVGKEDIQIILACDFGSCDDNLVLAPEVVKKWATNHELE